MDQFQSQAKDDLAAIQQVTLTGRNMRWFRTNVTKIKRERWTDGFQRKRNSNYLPDVMRRHLINQITPCFKRGNFFGLRYYFVLEKFSNTNNIRRANKNA